ncbi:major facilitator superfamily domain-containing protein 12-like [Clytia hemisphaerica]|uniref:major facilitator superfamily domain-containing protein 12-like n=1 Tax=Clytia hemisphaerica TaxID=252671 RepID=UPI0034D7410F
MTRQGHGHTPRPISEDSSSPGPSYRLETASNIQFPDQNDEPSICDRIKAFFHQLPNRQTEALVIGQTFYWMNTKFVYFFLLVHMTKDIQISHLTIGALVLFVKIFEAFLSLGLRCMQPRIKIKFYGSRKMQHGIGAVCSMVTLPLLFSSCSWFREPFSGVVRRDIFYFFMMLFYFLGVRIVGLMLELLQKSHWKVKLDSPRQSIQKCSMLNECFTDLLLFATIWLVLAIHSNKKIESNELLSIALTIMVFGIIFNILFHCIFNENHKATKHDQEDVEVIETNHEHGDETTKEKEELNNPSNDDEIPYHLARILLSKKEDISFNRILKDKEFWIRSILYIGTRCLVLVIYFYLVLYLIDSLQTSKVWIGGLLFWYIATYWLFKAVVHFMIQVLGTHICWFIGYTAIIGFSLLCGTLKPETHLTMFVTLLFLSIGINFLTEISLNWLKEYYGEGKVIEIALKEKVKSAAL